MTTKSTPDERFLIKLYETAIAGGDPCAPMNYLAVAKMVGLKETAIKNIVKHLAQANFLKKVNDDKVSLTGRGCSLVLSSLKG